MPRMNVVGPSLIGWETEEEAIFLFTDDPHDALDRMSARIIVQTILREQVMTIEEERREAELVHRGRS